MKSKSKSSRAFSISLALHLLASAIGFFFWYDPEPSLEPASISAVLMQVDKPKTKRLTRPKRAQVRKQTQKTSHANLKVLTSNAPATNRGIVSAAEPTKFNALESLDLSGGIGLSTNAINLDQGMPKIEKVIQNPIEKESTEKTRPKSRLVKFIERQEGPQRIVYCVDVSSSMLGLNSRKLEKIIAIMQDSLTFLELHDHFNLMTFSSKIEFYQRDFIAVSDESISQASAYLDTVKPTKSTSYTDKDMVEALQEAQKTPPTIIVLFSDGILTSGLPDPKKMREHTADNVRVFTMATEMAEDFPGAVLLRTLADGSNGEFWLVQ